MIVLAHVIPDMMVTAFVVLTSTNALLTNVTLMALALTMMNHTPALVMTAMVVVKHVLTSSVFKLMPVTPMLHVLIATVPLAAHVTVVTPVTVLLTLIIMSVHSEQTIAMSTHLAPITRVHFFVLVMQDGKVPEMPALTSINVLPKHTSVIHKEPPPKSMLPSNVLVSLDMLGMISFNPT